MHSSLRCYRGPSLAVRIGRILIVLLVLGVVADMRVPSWAQIPVVAGGAAQASLVTGDLYLYNTNGTVRDVTAQYQAWGYVLDESGNPMAICLADDHTILDGTRSKVIGFVATASAVQAQFE